MTDLLTLQQARDALGWNATKNQGFDAELVSDYIPTVTQTIEAECGRMVDRRESWFTEDTSPITTPWTAGAVKVVACSLGRFSDWTFDAPTLTVTDADYVPGVRLRIVASGLPTPAPVLTVAKRVLSRLWNADHQGTGDNRPGGTPSSPAQLTAEDLLLLAPYRKFDGPA